MSEDFLAQFLDSAPRARVARVFALNPSDVFTAAQAAKRAGLKTETALREIKTLQAIGILKRGKFSIKIGNARRVVAGKQKEPAWTYSTEFKHAPALSRFVHEISPIHYGHIVSALRKSGRLVAVILSGSFMGDSTRPADLLVAGEPLNETRLEHAIRSLEPEFGREIRYAAFSTPEFRYRLTIQDRLIRETLDYPHLVLLDKVKML